MISHILALKYQCKLHIKDILNKHTHYHTQNHYNNYHQITTPNKHFLFVYKKKSRKKQKKQAKIKQKNKYIYINLILIIIIITIIILLGIFSCPCCVSGWWCVFPAEAGAC